MKVHSRQGNSSTCLFHSLINLGYGNFSKLLHFNKLYKKIYRKKLMNLLDDRQEVNEIIRSYCDGKYFIFVGFCSWSLKRMGVKVGVYKCKYIRELPKSFRGVVCVETYSKRGKYDETHAVAVKDGHVFDSHFKHSIPVAKYKHQNIYKAYQILS